MWNVQDYSQSQHDLLSTGHASVCQCGYAIHALCFSLWSMKFLKSECYLLIWWFWVLPDRNSIVFPSMCSRLTHTNSSCSEFPYNVLAGPASVKYWFAMHARDTTHSHRNKIGQDSIYCSNSTMQCPQLLRSGHIEKTVTTIADEQSQLLRSNHKTSWARRSVGDKWPEAQFLCRDAILCQLRFVHTNEVVVSL